MSAPITITPLLVAELWVEGEWMPVYAHVIDHPDACILVDTGMTERSAVVVEAFNPRLYPLNEQDIDLAGIDIVINTHLHADHCGGNHLFAGRPIYVQRRELDDAHSNAEEYPMRDWVDAPGVTYMPVEGEFDLLPGIRLVPAPGHTDGMQIVDRDGWQADHRRRRCGGVVRRAGRAQNRGPAPRPRARSRTGLARPRTQTLATGRPAAGLSA
jgi:N-acyl homoserine lactone hydrolase